MGFFLPAPLYLFILSCILVRIGYFTYRQIKTRLTRLQIIKNHGCEPPRSFDDPSNFPYVYSLKFIKMVRSATKERRLFDAVQRKYSEYGNTHSAKLFHEEMLFTVDAENIKTILATKFKDFELPYRRKTASSALLGSGIFTTDGSDWKHSRELLRPSFAREHVADLENFEEHLTSMFDAIPMDGKTTVDLQELFFKLTIDTASDFLFGESTNVLRGKDSPNSKANLRFAEAWHRSQLEILNHARSSLYYRAPKEYLNDMKIVKDYVGQHVQQGLQYRNESMRNPEKAASKNRRYVFMHELVKTLDDPVRIRDEMLNVLLAGRDTTACFLSNTWFTLARRPDVWAKLRKEIDETLHGNRPTFEELKAMRYLKAVMNESLRLHVVIPANSRQAIRDTVLPVGGGPDGKSPVLVRKGQMVNFTSWVMHRRPDYFGPDAEEFIPERWEHIRPTWEYLPFNGGPRVCLGQQYALTEAGYTTVRLMQRFAKVESRDDRPWTENVTLTACSLYGTQVVLTPA